MAMYTLVSLPSNHENCSFPWIVDPITLGHEDVVRRAEPLFDQIIVAVGVNSTKKSRFSKRR